MVIFLDGLQQVRSSFLLFNVAQNFSGQKNLQPSRRPPAYPSQHTSHFSIGILPGHQLNTHSKKTYVKHNTRPVSNVKFCFNTGRELRGETVGATFLHKYFISLEQQNFPGNQKT